MAVTPDFIASIGNTYKWIVGRHATVEIEPQDAADVVSQVLRGIALAAIADAEEQVPLTIKRDATAEVTAARRGRICELRRLL